MSTPLEGTSHLGKIYDVKNGKFADADSIVSDDAHQLFEFSDTDKTQSLGSVDYDYSDDFLYQNLAGARYEKTESYSMEELYTTTSVSLNISGSYGAFSSELEGSYSDSYLENSTFYSYAEKRLYQLYSLRINASLSDPDSLIALLKSSVKDDLLAIDSQTAADNFVEKYGTHFLFKGYYGGRWQYTENVSEYYYSTESDMSLKFTANYADYESSIAYSSSVDTIQDYSQSDGIFFAKGGDASTLSAGFDAWADSIEEQNKHVLCDFDDTSLQPVSILTTNEVTKTYLLIAIQSYLSNSVTLKGFAWDDGDVKDIDISGGGDEETLTLAQDGLTTKVIVGMALHSSNSQINRVAYKVADLDENTTEWLTSTGDDFNTSDYEAMVELDSGYIATGMGLRVGDGKVKNLTLYYQAVDAVNIDNNNYLASTVKSKTSGSGDNYYYEYAPGNGNDRILIGAGFHVKDKELRGFTVYTAPLKVVTSTVETTVVASMEEPVEEG